MLFDLDDEAEAGLPACAVAMNGEPLVMTKGETELEILPFVEGGELLVLWQKHRENMGEAIEITTSEPHLLSSKVSGSGVDPKPFMKHLLPRHA